MIHFTNSIYSGLHGESLSALHLLLFQTAGTAFLAIHVTQLIILIYFTLGFLGFVSNLFYKV